MEQKGIPICSCLRCALDKSEGREVPQGCARPVVKMDGGDWVIRECWKFKKAWDEELMTRVKAGEFGDSAQYGTNAQ